MKKQTLAAYILAATTLVMSSCFLFNKKEKTPPVTQASIAGKWQLTSVTDSTKNANSLIKLLLENAVNDSTKTFASFNADSSLTLSYSTKQAAETTHYIIDTAVQKLVIKSKTANDTLTIAALNDSLLQLKKDSTYITFKKLP